MEQGQPFSLDDLAADTAVGLLAIKARLDTGAEGLGQVHQPRGHDFAASVADGQGALGVGRVFQGVEDRADARCADLGDRHHACAGAGGTRCRGEHAADGVEDHVRAVRGELPDAAGGPFALGDRFGAERLYVPVVVCGGGADDADPRNRAIWTASEPTPASRSVHEQGLAGLNVQGVDDGLVGGQSCQQEACCLGEAHGAGLADEDAYIGGD